MNEQEQTSLMIEKSDSDLIKYADNHISVDSKVLIYELVKRWRQEKSKTYHLEGKLALIDELSKKKVVRL